MPFTLTRSQWVKETHLLLHLAIPLAGAQLAQAATGFVDTVMMGILGQQTLAAGALGASLFTCLLLIGTSILASVSPLAAAAFGAGKTEEVSHVVRQGLWLAAVIALPSTVLLWQGGVLMQILGQEEQNTRLASAYLRAIAWGIFPALGFAVLRNFVSALSQPRPVIVIMVIGTLFNVAANYVLMLGKLGFPALGIVGIGCASVLSLWGMFLALTLYVLWQPQLRTYRIFHHLQRFEKRMFWDLVQIGVPIGVLAAMETGLFTLTTFLMGQLGTVTLAAHQIALQTAALTFMIPLGISYATTVRVGQEMGKNNLAGAKRAGYLGMGVGAVFMALMGLVFWTIPEAIVSLYLDIHDPENFAVVDLAKILLGIAAVFQLVDGIQVTAVGALRGIQDTQVPMLIGIFAYWCVGFSSGYVLGFPLGWGGVGLWWGLAIGLAVAAAILTWRFSKAHLRTNVDSR
ncbi:MAG: MATE family efflux transporter [Drouetiella hepatica Uher 2000/2452]|jgi:MATE family multidrug resistance protein|uniref:Probable multidrug resistance protein NorM n=1 Tax=Drouetiella hepatica Uher 2000/2452 TaxID=904376 RepID=A0A951Q8W8_9CYAN|nr:MATE family efflux transporter [Drouetiella hepatica Uher 2000/2452]